VGAFALQGATNELSGHAAIEALASEDLVREVVQQSAPRLKAVSNGSRRHLLKIVHEELEAIKPMEDLSEAVGRYIERHIATMRTEAASRVRTESKKRGAVDTAEEGSWLGGTKRQAL